MSFMAGRFEPIANVDSEVKELYRIRDNDAEWANKKGHLVNRSSLTNFHADSWRSYQMKIGIMPLDSIWLNMSEQERIENGLPSRFKCIMKSPYAIMFYMIWGGVAGHLMSRVYYPGGIILRNQRKEGIFGYLYKRLPLTLLFAYALYAWNGYELRNYVINFHSNEEDEIDRRLANISS